MRVLLFLLIFCGNAFAMMPMLGGGGTAGGTGGGGEPDCTTLSQTESTTVTNSMRSTTRTHVQEFKAPAAGTNVVITWRAYTPVDGTAPSGYTLYLDNDKDFNDDLYGSQTGSMSTGTNTYCTVITSGTGLTYDGTYYILWKNNDADYADRFSLVINAASAAIDDIYPDGDAWTKGSGDLLDFTTGTSELYYDDMYFTVSVGDDCECE